PYETVPPLGAPPTLPAREAPLPASHAATGLRTALVIDAACAEDRLRTSVTLAGTPLCQRHAAGPARGVDGWQSPPSGPTVAAQRMADAGRLLAAALFDEPSHRLVTDLLDRLPPGNWIDVVLAAEGAAATLPVELLRLTTAAGADSGPLGLRAGVTITRRVS